MRDREELSFPELFGKKHSSLAFPLSSSAMLYPLTVYFISLFIGFLYRDGMGGWQIGAKIDDHIFLVSREGRIVMRKGTERNVRKREDASLRVEFRFSLISSKVLEVILGR